MEEDSFLRTSLKYFLHGILFSIIYIFLTIFWIFVLAFLIAFGFIIGFIIAFIVLFFLIGGINVYLTDRIWDVSLKEDWMSLLSHGFVLFVALILVHIPAIIVVSFVFSFTPNTVVTILLLIVYAFIDGFVAANVAPLWEEEYEE
jgi:hypothetical protein